MSRAEERLSEDRELRDAARAVFLADLDHAKTNFTAKGVAGRVGSRIGDGAKDVLEVAKVQAEDNRGVIAALIGAVALWLSREPILEIFGLATAAPPDETAAEVAQDKFKNEGAAKDAPDKWSGDDDEQ